MNTDHNNIRQLGKRNPTDFEVAEAQRQADKARKTRQSAAAAQARHNAGRNKRAKEAK